jgi:hypothetical protein
VESDSYRTKDEAGSFLFTNIICPAVRCNLRARQYFKVLKTFEATALRRIFAAIGAI